MFAALAYDSVYMAASKARTLFKDLEGDWYVNHNLVTL